MIRFLTNSNIWVSFCALALTASSEILFQTTNYSISQFVFFATFFTYNFQRVVKIKKNKIRPSEIWLKQNRSIIFPLMFLALIFSFYHFINFKLATHDDAIANYDIVKDTLDVLDNMCPESKNKLIKRWGKNYLESIEL